MKKIFSLVLSYIFFIILLFLCYSYIFSLQIISGGDYTMLTKEFLDYQRHYSLSSWLGYLNTGWSLVGILNYAPYYGFIGLISPFFNYNGILIERIVWWFPFFIFSFISIFYFLKLLHFTQLKILSFLIFIFNTYIFMVLGGGQVSGIGFAYSIAPLVLTVFIKLINRFYLAGHNFQFSLLAGLVLAAQVMFDIRITYITMIGIFLYWIFALLFIDSYSLSLEKINPSSDKQKSKIKNTFQNFKIFFIDTFFTFVIPIGLAGLLHAFWILPTMLFHSNPIEQFGLGYTTTEAVRFFSFAKFEHTISLLHPNWPENIFGKTYFMRWEFIGLPILAFSSLLFVIKSKINPRFNRGQKSKAQLKSKKFNYDLTIEQSNNETILFYALLGLLGAFLAKGANEPFGQVYLWMFNYVPGFILFRDPTKWYTLVAISYSILIPFSIFSINSWIRSNIKNKISNIHIKNQIFNISYVFLIFTILYLLFLIRPALFGQLSGTFKPHSMPKEYIAFKDFINGQPQFFRTFWIPQKQRFGFFSNTHPAINGGDFFHDTLAFSIVQKLKSANTQKLLQESAVKYVIVPYDSEREIFLKDRKYDEKQYKKAIEETRKIRWLKEVDFGKIVMFEVPNSRDHFWIESRIMNHESGVTYQQQNPTKYIVKLSNVKKGDVLVFSEGFDKNWQAEIKGIKHKVLSSKYKDLFNSFVLPKDESYTLEVYYEPQRWVNVGLAISGATLVLIIGSLIGFKIEKMVKLR